MRILQVIASMGIGGAETLVRDMSAGFMAEGDQILVASSGGVREESLRKIGVETARIPLVGRRPLAVLKAGLQLRKAIRSFDPDVVLSHNVGSTLVSRIGLLAAGSRVPLVTTFHGVAQEDYRSTARVYSACRATVVVVAQAIGDRLVREGLNAARLRQIPNAVSRPAHHDRAQARAKLELPQDAFVALCAARLVPQKRHDVLLEAWKLMPSSSILSLAGDGELRPEIEKLAADEALGGRVQVLGNRDDVDWLLAAADTFVLASDWEGMPLAVLEALELGLPVVATDVDGLRQACAGRATLVPPRDPVALAAALTTTLESSSQNSQVASSKFGQPGTSAVDRMTERYRALFSELISARSNRLHKSRSNRRHK
jgi:glycosyltransferase involved in cell wall biosynthesis